MYGSLRHLNALRAFEAAARHSSIAKASAELNVSHSVISQHVRNLEQWFGTSLFERHGNRIELTAEGRQFESQVAHGLQVLSDACEGLLLLSQTGSITISAEPAIASRWLRKKISEFSEQYPRIECNLRSEWRTPAIGENQVDAVIHFEERIQRIHAESAQLFPLDGFPACAPEIYERLNLSENWDDFTSFPLIHDNGRHIWQQWFSEHAGASEVWTEGKVYSDLALAIDAAVDGEGIILADDIICHKELANGTLKRIDDHVSRCTWYSVAIDENAPANSAVATFKKWIVAEAQKRDFRSPN
ncbi:LysR family transcriptional regulator [uncultured Ruegeria sp.]|uniref:LysR family transcriptional regulator n=1 Tax=uncultured Ruegeria sp. TaxID=259304 RepID=UPI00260DD980|nr:LysR family transcriptional regulator [uncultured Ruegeria sp.]